MKNILLVAFDFDPVVGSEARFAYSWAKLAEKYYGVYIITDIKHKKNLDKVECSLKITYCTFVSEGIRALLEKFRAYNVLYKLFIRSVRKVLKSGAFDNMDLIHCLTPAGYYAYNDLYQFSKPVLSGPVGGGLKLPESLKQFRTPKYRIREVYYKLIRMSPRWKEYFENCVNILIGTPNLLSHLPQNTHSKTIEFFDTIVDTDKFIPGTDKDPEYTTIVYSGRMDNYKGCIILLEAFKRLIDCGYSNVQLIMLGDGPEYRGLLKMAKANNLGEYLHLPGNVSIEEVKHYLKKADIFCLPSVKENGGTSILEAMACALPVIVMNHGGPAVSVTSDCGIKIKPSDYNSVLNELTAALSYLIDRKDVRINMGLNARNRAVNEFSYKSLENRIKNLYDGIFSEVPANGTNYWLRTTCH